MSRFVALKMLRPEIDELVCVHVPQRLIAVGQFYEDFSQVGDEQVREALRNARD